MPLSRHWLFIASGVVLVAMSILNAKDASLSALLRVEETALPSLRETISSRSTSGRRVLFYDTTMITGSINPLRGGACLLAKNFISIAGNPAPASIDKVENSAQEKYVKLTYGGHFHYVRGLYPRDVQTTFALYGRSSLRSPGGGDPARVVVLPHAAYLPPWDMHFSYHMAGDVILPLLQALRHRVMNLHCSDPTKLPRPDPTHLLVYRPIRTTFGFEAKSCNTGLQTCLIAGNAGVSS